MKRSEALHSDSSVKRRRDRGRSQKRDDSSPRIHEVSGEHSVQC